MTTRRIVRCTEGHPYDDSAYEVCPVCGAAPAGQASVAPLPDPGPLPQKRGWMAPAIVSAAVVIAVGGGASYLFRPASGGPPYTRPDAGVTPPVVGRHSATEAPSAADKAEADKEEADKEEAEKAEAAKAAAARQAADQAQADEIARKELAEAEARRAEEARDEAAKAQAAKAEAEAEKAEAEKAAAEKAAADKAQADAAAKQQPEPDPRVTQFMTIDAATVEAMRHALAPVEPAESNATLDAIAPPIERRLRLSMFLREILANERAVQALNAHDYMRMKTILSAIVSLPPAAPGIVSLAAHRNLAMYYAREGAPRHDLAYASRLTTMAAKGGLPSAMVLLLSRPGLKKISGIDDDALEPLLFAAMVQDPVMLEPVFRKYGLKVDNEKAFFASFDKNLSQRDWSEAIAVFQQYGNQRMPVLEMLLSQALILAPNNAAYMDRALVGAVAGGAASYSIGTDLLGYFCLEGLDGVTRDAPNAAGWLIATLFGLPKDDKNWAGSRERYQQAKSKLQPEQREAIEQLAREFGVE